MSKKAASASKPRTSKKNTAPVVIDNQADVLAEIAAIEASLAAEGVVIAPVEAAPAAEPVVIEVEQPIIVEANTNEGQQAEQPRDILATAAAKAYADKEALRLAGESAAVIAKRDMTADRAVTTPAHHALVISRLGNISEPARLLLIDCAGTAGILEGVLSNLEAHGKSALASALESIVGRKNSSSAFTNNMIGLLADYAAGKREFTKADFGTRYNKNQAQGERFASPLKAFMRQIGAIESERGSSFSLKADNASLARLIQAGRESRQLAA